MIIHSAAKATSREILDQRWDEAQIRAFGREAFEAMKAIKQKPEIGQKTDPMPEEIPVGCTSDCERKRPTDDTTSVHKVGFISPLLASLILDIA